MIILPRDLDNGKGESICVRSAHCQDDLLAIKLPATELLHLRVRHHMRNVRIKCIGRSVS
jgi:hypothetical protein